MHTILAPARVTFGIAAKSGNKPHVSARGSLRQFARLCQPNRPIVDTDVVVQYTFGVHHVVRPEDGPVLPATSIGFNSNLLPYSIATLAWMSCLRCRRYRLNTSVGGDIPLLSESTYAAEE